MKIERKGAAIPYTSLNGHMFSNLNSPGLMAFKLPGDEIDKFFKKYKTLFKEYGIIQQKSVAAPDRLRRKTDEFTPYFDLSYEFVGTPKANPTKKRTAP